MKPETIEIIYGLLRSDVESKRCSLLGAIENKFVSQLDMKISQYQKAFDALCDFEEMVEEMEEEQ